MKSLLYYFAGVSTAVLFLFLLNPFNFIRPSTTVNTIDQIESPDSAFIATTNKASNGNWCEIRTNIHRIGESFDWKREFVFNIDCGSDIEVKWKGDRDLAISYSYNNNGEVRTFRQFRSKDKEVSISYYLKQ